MILSAGMSIEEFASKQVKKPDIHVELFPFVHEIVVCDYENVLIGRWQCLQLAEAVGIVMTLARGERIVMSTNGIGIERYFADSLRLAGVQVIT